jgi:hypothetical protein
MTRVSDTSDTASGWRNGEAALSLIAGLACDARSRENSEW